MDDPFKSMSAFTFTKHDVDSHSIRAGMVEGALLRSTVWCEVVALGERKVSKTM